MMSRISPEQVCAGVIKAIDPPNGKAMNPHERLGKSKLAAAVITKILIEHDGDYSITYTQIAQLLGYKDHASVCELRRGMRSGRYDAAAQLCGWPNASALHKHLERQLGFPDLNPSRRVQSQSLNLHPSRSR